VQEAIRETLPSSTVVEIAHRLHTVIGADRIMVMAGMCLALNQHSGWTIPALSGELESKQWYRTMRQKLVDICPLPCRNN
jgi:ABC-type transport system involved in cytochrome bd biosynthesis fused ATPase/permease subunit